MGVGTAGTGVLGRGLVMGAWYVLSDKGASFGWSILACAGFRRSGCFFPDVILFFLACNTWMYLLSSASSKLSVPQSEPSTSSSSLIGSKWEKRLELFSFMGPKLWTSRKFAEKFSWTVS